jgi:hypothetical protein
MPPSRSITLLSPDELRVELVALLSDAFLHYATRGRLARERSSQEKSIESETSSLGRDPQDHTSHPTQRNRFASRRETS